MRDLTPKQAYNKLRKLVDCYISVTCEEKGFGDIKLSTAKVMYASEHGITKECATFREALIEMEKIRNRYDA